MTLAEPNRGKGLIWRLTMPDSLIIAYQSCAIMIIAGVIAFWRWLLHIA